MRLFLSEPPYAQFTTVLSFPWLEKCLIQTISPLLLMSKTCAANHFRREYANENKQFNEIKTRISNSCFLRQILERWSVRCQYSLHINKGLFKGTIGYVRELNWICNVVDKFLRIHLRHKTLSINPECERKVNVQNCTFGWIWFQNYFFLNFLITTTKNLNKILQ